MKKDISKSKKIVLICAGFFLLLIMLFSFNLNYRENMFVDASKISLQALADEKASQVNTFIESQKEKLEIIASMDVFREALMYPNDSVKIEMAKEAINQLKDTIPGIGVLTKEGIIIVAENNPAGTDYSMLPGFPVNDNMGITFSRYYDQQRKKDYYGIGGPVYDSLNKSKVIGVIAFDVELSKISILINESFDSRTTEVYLIDENGLLLSGSKYIGKGNKNGVLIQEVKSDGAKVCLEDLKKYGKNGIIEEHEENVSKYLNYMGNEVYGAHAYAPVLNGCVMAEENVDDFSKYSINSYVTNIFKKEVKDEE